MKTSSTCIACCLWVAACSSSSLAAAATAELQPGPERALELELALARQPTAYLVLDTARRSLAVKVGGLQLAAHPVAEVAVVQYRRRFGDGSRPGVELPVVLGVSEEGRGDRRAVRVAPRPQPGDRDEPREGPPPGSGASPAPDPVSAVPAAPVPPDSYRFGLEDGWELRVGRRGVLPGLGTRLGLGLAGLADVLRGRPVREPVIVAVVIEPDSARSLHHLLRSGAKLLVR